MWLFLGGVVVGILLTLLVAIISVVSVGNVQ